MARKTASIIIPHEEGNRDSGKIFIIREMPASVAEKWATRALLALTRSGADIPSNIEGAGLAGLAVLGFQALAHANFEDIEPLLDEMMQCLSVQPDARQPNITRPLLEDDIEEIATRLRLRAEVFTLHTGFSIPGVNSTSSTTTPELMPAGSPLAPTSQPRLRRSSPPGKRRSTS